MNLWDKIINSSGLNECNSISKHICTAIKNGLTQIVYRDTPLIITTTPINDICVNIKEIDEVVICAHKIENAYVDIYSEKEVDIDVNKLKKPLISIKKC